MTAVTDQGRDHGQGEPEGAKDAPGDDGRRWDDGLIARRAAEAAQEDAEAGRTPQEDEPGPQVEAYGLPGSPLRPRLDALRELVGLSRARLDGDTLAEAGRVLDEASARQRLSSRHTVVAIAGATGSGKSTLFNALAGVQISDTGLRRPTTSAPIACSWTDGAAGLLDRLAIPGLPGAGPCRAARPPTRPSRGSSWWTCPTTTRRRPATGSRWTGCWPWSTP